MSAKWLKDINDIDGIAGTLLCSNKGEILEDNCNFLDNDKKDKINLHLIRIIAAHHLQGKMIREIELIWQNYHVIAKNAPEFLIISFCTSAKVISILRMTLNVLIAQLLDDKKFSKLLRKNKSEKSIVLRKGKLLENEINLISKLQ